MTVAFLSLNFAQHRTKDLIPQLAIGGFACSKYVALNLSKYLQL